MVGFMGCKLTFWLVLSPTSNSRSFSAELLSYPFIPQLMSILGVAPTQVQDLTPYEYCTSTAKLLAVLFALTFTSN